MKNVLLGLVIAVGAFMTAAPAFAHHSFAATYFEDKKMTVEGNLVQFLFRNPHSFVQVEAPDDSGNMVRWAVEWAGGGQLGQQGVTRETLKPGGPCHHRWQPWPATPKITVCAWSTSRVRRMVSSGAERLTKPGCEGQIR